MNFEALTFDHYFFFGMITLFSAALFWWCGLTVGRRQGVKETMVISRMLAHSLIDHFIDHHNQNVVDPNCQYCAIPMVAKMIRSEDKGTGTVNTEDETEVVP